MKKILLFLTMFFVCNICYAQLRGQVSKIEQIEQVESIEPIAITFDPVMFVKSNSTNQYSIRVICYMLKENKYSNAQIDIYLGDNKEKAIQSITYLIKAFDNNNIQNMNITDSYNRPFSISTMSIMGVQNMIITDDENMGIITKDILDFILYKLNKE